MMRAVVTAVALLFLIGIHSSIGFSLAYKANIVNLVSCETHSFRRDTTTCCLFAEKKTTGGTARFTGLEKDDTTSGLDYVLSLIVSDVGSTILGLVGLIVCVAHRLADTDSLSVDSLGQETRADLLAVFASGAVLLNGISKLDVTSALAESVILEGDTLPEPVYNQDVPRQQDVTWALESLLSATPAKTAVLLSSKDDNWIITAVAGVLPRDPVLRQAPLVDDATPILNRFRNDSTKESYLPTLQALPGRVEFTYLPSNTQGALLVPVNSETVLALGSNVAKAFSPRDIAWCLSIARRIGTFLA